jgi:hypothetical protein
MQLQARSIIAHIVATDPRYRFAMAVSDPDGGCLPEAERPRIRAKAKECHALADVAASADERRHYRHLAHAYECLAGEDT